MTASPGFLMTVLSFLACIGPLIFIHELGHYFVGRWFGVKAEAFSIGFGREIFGWTDRRGTRWKVGWLPLGGYVKFKGDMNPASQASPEWLSLPAEERAETFQGKPLWQRFLIVAAGPVTNLLAAVLIFIGIFAAIGYPSNPAIVTAVVQDSPAHKAGISAGDKIVAIDDKGIRNFAEVREFVMLRPAAHVTVTVEREGQQLDVQLTTGSSVARDDFGNEAKIGTLGVLSNALVLEKLQLSRLPVEAVRQTWTSLEQMVVALGQFIMGDRSVEELGGPLKIAQISGQQASLGWLPFFWLMAVVSINLGFINLLPIPLLDGGHLLFYTLEGIRRRPLRPETMEWAFRTGLAALLVLMIFVTFNDLASFGLWNSLGGLIH